MSDTRAKLDESQFFLDLMEENIGTKEFDNYLNAFLSSARSVLWIMRAEYSKSVAWEEWYSSRQPTEEQAELLKLTTTLRNTSQKKKPIKSHFEIQLTVPKEYVKQAEELREQVGRKGTMTFYLDGKPKAGGKGVAFMAKLDHNPYRKVPGSERPIIRQCEEYMDMLNELIEECEKLFGTPEANAD